MRCQRSVAAFVAIALVAVGCSSAEDDVTRPAAGLPGTASTAGATTATTPPTATTTAPIPTASTVSAVSGSLPPSPIDGTQGASGPVAADPGSLDAAGVQVVENIGNLTEVLSPVVLTRVQADRLLADVGPDAGVYGASIDGLVPLPGAPMSFLLATWVSTGESPGAETARAWMGDHDWALAPSIRFPLAVITLFVNDLATAVAAVAIPDDESLQLDLGALLPPGPDDVPDVNGFANGFAGRTAAPSFRAGPCTAVENFVSAAVAAVVNALHINPSPVGEVLGDLGRFFVDWYNRAVDLAGPALKGLIDELTGPIFDAIRSGLATLALATQFASLFVDKKLTVTLAPPGSLTRFAVGAEPDITGQFIARSDSLSGKWPPELVDCAGATGVTLPTPIGVGADARWTVSQPMPLITPGPTFSKVQSDLTTRLDFVTGRESEDVAASGEIAYGIVRARAEVPRMDIEQLLQLGRDQATAAKEILLRRIPLPPLRRLADGALSAVLDPVLDELQKEIEGAAAGWFTLSGERMVAVAYHEPPVTTTTTSPESPPGSDPQPDFCRQFRAMLDNARATSGTEIPEWAGEIARRLRVMRPAAPTDLIDDVDVMIDVYTVYASDGDIGDIIALAPVYAVSVAALSDACGVEPLALPL